MISRNLVDKFEYISSWFSLINRVHFFSVRKLLVVVRHEVRPMHGSWPWIPHSLIIRHVERHPQTHRCMWEIAHLHSSHMLCQNWWDRHSRADSTKQKSYCKLNVVHMQQRPKDLFFLSVVSKKNICEFTMPKVKAVTIIIRDQASTPLCANGDPVPRRNSVSCRSFRFRSHWIT